MRNLLCLFLLLPFFLVANDKAPRPNIILLMGDDHGWEETGYNDHPYLHTPFLDEMATQGIQLNNFYAMPSCSPTRGSILTGRHPNRYGIFSPGFSLRPEETTVAQLLKKAGYTNGHFGKWHVGPVKKSSPTSPNAMGFDEALAHDNFFELDPIFSRNGGEPKKYYGESSEIIVDEAIDFIKKNQASENPLFIMIWFGSPHEPYSAIASDLALYHDLPEKYASRKTKLTSNETGLPVTRPLRDVLIERYAEITAMDRSIGKLRNSLKTLGIHDNTLLWYCGDNGIPKSGLRESRLRGQKGTVYENGIRVPAVIEWPKGIKAPIQSNLNSYTCDMLPTLASLAGVTPVPQRPLDGIDIWPKLRQNEDRSGRFMYFWNYKKDSKRLSSLAPYIAPELQTGTTPLAKQAKGLYTRNFLNYRFTETTDSDYLGARSIISDDFKLVLSHTGKAELFNLKQDIDESENLADQHPQVLKDLSRELKTWQDSVLKSLLGQDY